MSKRLSKQKNRSGRPVVATRNTVARNPLMTKSCVHGRSKKAERRQDRIQLLKNDVWQSNGQNNGQNDQQSAGQGILLITLPASSLYLHAA